MPELPSFLSHPKAIDVTGVDLDQDEHELVIRIRWEGPNASTEQGLPLPIPAARKLLGYLEEALRVHGALSRAGPGSPSGGQSY